MEPLHFITNLLGIKDQNITIWDVLDAGTHKEIIAKLDYPAPKCYNCYGQMAKYDFQKESKIPYLECAGYKTLIRLRKRRFRCQDCGKVGIAETTATSIIGELGDIRRFQSTNQINAFIGIDLRHYESGNFLAKEHITKRGNPYARKILFKCIHNIASASHTNPCHIADFYEKRKRQSTIASTKPHAIASIHRLIRTMYYLITHNKLYDYSLTQNR